MIGQTLGNYQIEEEIGRGGMATVYRALESGVQRYVALKVMRNPAVDTETFRQRFRREAQTVANLEHFHILPLYAYGEEGDTAYFVMRYIPYGTLSELIEKGPIALNDAGRIIGQIASALDYAHKRGIIHRDVKPSNIMMDEDNNAYLTDFGIAKIFQATIQLTGDGSLVGTPTYMSPEQCQGDELTSASDTYALGIVLYEMLTGRVPFQSETPLALIHMHVNVDPPKPRTIDADLPPQVEAVLMKALRKNPSERYESTVEFADALNTAIQAAENEEDTLDVDGLGAIQAVTKRNEPLSNRQVEAERALLSQAVTAPMPEAATGEQVTQKDATVEITRSSLLLGIGGVVAILLALFLIVGGAAVFFLVIQPNSTNNASPIVDNGGNGGNGPAAESNAVPSGPVELTSLLEITDNFDNDAFNRTYNDDIWQLTPISREPFEIEQKEDALIISQSGKEPLDVVSLSIARLSDTRLEDPAYFGADIRIDNRNDAGVGFIRIAAEDPGADILAGTMCVFEGAPDDQGKTITSFCVYYFGSSEGTEYRFASEQQILPDDQWQSAFIAIDPNQGEFNYYLNGIELDSYVAPISDFEDLADARYTFDMGVWSYDDDPVAGFFDNVRAGIEEE